MKVAAAVAAVALLAGCPASSATDRQPKGDRGTTITEVTLSDGTRCAVMDKPEAAALDCDWQGAR